MIHTLINSVKLFFTKLASNKFLLIATLVCISLVVKFFAKEEVKQDSKDFNIEVSQVVNTSVSSYIGMDGVVDSDISADIVSEGTSLLQKILIKENEYVKTGDIVMLLDKRAMDENIESAKITAHNATVKFNTMQKLFDEGLESKANYDMAQAEMNRLNGAFIIAKNNNNHAIKSPFSGIITKIYPKEGDFIFGGGGMAKPSPVFHVVDPEQIIIKATISGSLLPFLDSNKAVEIVGNHHKVSGKIISHDKVINPATGTITCTIQPSNSKSLIFGSTVYVNIKHTFANVFSVPYNTILLDEDGLTYVKLLNGEQKVIKKLVNIVHEESNGTVLISNLKNNDKVIIKGQYLAELDSIVPQASVQTAV